MVSLNALLAYHDDLRELFLQHQEALLERAFARAVERLRTFDAALMRHMRDEEEVLMPVYEARVARTAATNSKLIHADHGKLVELLPELHAETGKLAGDPEPTNRKILALIDMERTYKNLLEHHDQRERNMFFPELDRVLNEEERAALLEQCKERAEGL